jgi:hypothetical protein
MKKNIVIILLILINICTAIYLQYSSWQLMLWRNEATINSEFAAKVWARNCYSKGKIIKLRLKIEQEPKGYVSQPTEFDGPYVVLDQIGYTDPFPLFGGTNSPSIKIAKIMVDAYNKIMKEMYENPGKYKEELAEETEYWKTNVLGKEGKLNEPEIKEGK